MILIYKYFLFLFITFTLSLNSFSQSEKSFYEISGMVKGIGNRKVILGNKPYRGYTMAFKIKYFDSCYSRNDSFYFRGHVDEPGWYSIEFEDIPGYSSFILENSKIIFAGELKDNNVYNERVEGSLEYDVFKDFSRKEYPLKVAQWKTQELNDLARENSDSILMTKYQDSLRNYWKLLTDAALNFIRLHPNNFVSVYELDQYKSFMNIDTAKNAFLSLANDLQNTLTGKRLKYQLFKIHETIKTGHIIPDFTLKDTSGQKVAISSIRARYILLDFWASWCGPCIAQFDHLKKMYKKYHSKGLEIIGINIDVNKEDWLSAVQKYKIPWLTLSDMRGDESEPYKIFNIKFIPQLYLLDSDCQLIAPKIESDQLDSLLHKYFDANL